MEGLERGIFMTVGTTNGDKNAKVQTTIRVPKPVYEEARDCVRKNWTQAETINDFFVTAIKAYLRLIQRKKIDAAFAGMATDEEYMKKAQLISEEFSASDLEALEIAEREAGA
jgi:hypothetical protein